MSALGNREAPYVVIGGGFYGCAIAESLAARRRAPVILVERADALLTRASFVNQARLHGGYHYPRSLGTAYRSRHNFGRFFAEYRDAICTDFSCLYAIARTSRVSPRQFASFCELIGARLEPARERFERLFSPRLVAAVFEVEEHVFDAAVLREIEAERLARAGVEVRLRASVEHVEVGARGAFDVHLRGGESIRASRVFNCTYARLHHVGLPAERTCAFKHELAEICIVDLPEPLQELGLTVMDGPYFSAMPFPALRSTSLTHVRYTPQVSWVEDGPDAPDPFAVLRAHSFRTKFALMRNDASRYLPTLGECVHRESLLDVKTVLVKNEGDDGRPILLERSHGGRVVSVLGSKIDNVYDVLAAIEDLLEAEPPPT